MRRMSCVGANCMPRSPTPNWREFSPTEFKAVWLQPDPFEEDPNVTSYTNSNAEPRLLAFPRAW